MHVHRVRSQCHFFICHFLGCTACYEANSQTNSCISSAARMQGHRKRGCSRVQPRARSQAQAAGFLAKPVQRHVKSAALSGPEAVLNAALDKVLTQITRIVQDHEAKQRKLSAEKGAGAAAAAEASTPGKDISFKAGCGKEKTVKQPQKSQAGRGLPQYLALPLDQYSLLDPTWITRPDPDGQPDLFVLKVPLHGVMHVSLEPSVCIRVNVDAAHSQVHFYASSFKLGDSRFDERFTLDLNATLSSKPASNNFMGRLLQPPSWSKSEQQQQGEVALAGSMSAASSAGHETATAPALSTHLEDHSRVGQIDGSQDRLSLPGQALHQTGHASTVDGFASHEGNGYAAGSSNSVSAYNSYSIQPYHDNGTSSASAGDVASQIQQSQSGAMQEGSEAPNASAGVLKAKVDMAFQFHVPPPLSVVPAPLLALAGSLVARAALNSMLPAFLDLLSVDYGRWATGTRSKDQAVGSLVSSSQQHSSTPTLSPAAASIFTDQSPPQQQLSALRTTTHAATPEVHDVGTDTHSGPASMPREFVKEPLAVVGSGHAKTQQ